MLLEGNLNPFAIAITAGGAALAVGIQLAAWRGLGRGQSGSQSGSQKRGGKVQ